MLIGNLSNAADKGGVTGLALYNNKGAFIASYPMPIDEHRSGQGRRLRLRHRSESGEERAAHFELRGLERTICARSGEVVKDPEAMKHFGATVVVWNLKSMKPAQILSVPGAPLEMRWGLAPGQNWAVTAAALTSRIWLFKQDAGGRLDRQGRRGHRRPGQDTAARGYLDLGQRQGAVGQHFHGRDHPLL